MATSPQLVFTRGARRSAAPSVVPVQPMLTGALQGQNQLARLLYQPQQAIQLGAAPAVMQQTDRTPEETELTRALQMSGIPQLTIARPMTESTEESGNLGNEARQPGFDPNAGPMSPATSRVLRTLLTVGLGGMGLPSPMLAALGGAINNPDSSTAPISNVAGTLVKQQIPGLAALETLAQAFGVDPISRQIDQQAQSALQQSAAREVQAPAPVSDAVYNPNINQLDVDPETLQALLDAFNNYDAFNRGQGGNWSGGFGVNQSAGGTTNQGEGGGGFGGRDGGEGSMA